VEQGRTAGGTGRRREGHGSSSNGQVKQRFGTVTLSRALVITCDAGSTWLPKMHPRTRRSPISP